MSRLTEITIFLEPNTEYHLVKSNGTFVPPLPKSIVHDTIVKTQCESPASFEYNGSANGVKFGVTGSIVQSFEFSGMDLFQYRMMENGIGYKVALIPSKS